MSSEKSMDSNYIWICPSAFCHLQWEFVRTAPIPQLTSIMPIDSQVLILYNKWKEENIVANV